MNSSESNQLMKVFPQFSRRIEGAIPVALLALVLCGCGPKDAEIDPVAIRVGEREVRLSEIQAEFDALKVNGSPLAADRERFMESYVERLAALERARELGLHEDIELRRQAENLLIGRLKQIEVHDKLEAVEVREDEVQAYYEAHLDTYRTPAQVRLALLYLETPKHMSAEARDTVRTKMEEARQRAQDLPSDVRGFGADAMTYSEEATSRFKGGDIGWLQDGAVRYRWPDAVVRAGFALDAVDSLSEVIETEDGFYLLKKLDGRESSLRPLGARVESSLKTDMLREKRAKLAEQLQARWDAQSSVELYDEVIAEIDFSNRPQGSEPATEFTAVP